MVGKKTQEDTLWGAREFGRSEKFYPEFNTDIDLFLPLLAGLDWGFMPIRFYCS